MAAMWPGVRMDANRKKGVVQVGRPICLVVPRSQCKLYTWQVKNTRKQYLGPRSNHVPAMRGGNHSMDQDYVR